MSIDINSSSSSDASKPWLSLVIMFAAGLAGGAVALTFFSSSNHQPRASSGPTAPEEHVVEVANDRDTASTDIAQADAAALEELRNLRKEVAQLRTESQASAAINATSATSAAARTNFQQPLANPPGSNGERTLAYWNGMNSIMAREAAMRAAPPQLTAENATSFVTGQSSAFEFASAALQQLSVDGVDPRALELGREITAWYDRGIANSRTAESLLGSSDIAARQGSSGQSWSAAERQHREECLAINRRGEQLRQQLSRKYGLRFPALQ